MNETDLFMKTFSGGLKAVSKGIYSFAEMLDKMKETPEKEAEEEAQAPEEVFPEMPEVFEDAAEEEAAPQVKRPVGRPRKKPGQEKKKKSAIDKVYGVIKRAKADGISLDEISKKTGFDKAKINNIIFRLKDQKKVVAVKRGTYRKTTREEVKKMEAEEALAGNLPVSETEAVEIGEGPEMAQSEEEIEPPAVEPEIEPEEAKEE